MENSKKIKKEKKKQLVQTKTTLFKKFKIQLNKNLEHFKTFRKTNKYWKFITSFFEDIIIYAFCGYLIFLPFFKLTILNCAISFAAILYIYSTYFHKKLIDIFNYFSLIKIQQIRR